MEPNQQTFHYDVFISFRGEDTRNTFTSHLHGALRRHNFDIFHDISLPRGLGIAPQLLEAIKQSKIFVVVFSTNYADSKWCLDELSHMMYYMHMNTQQIILPVFLDVKQSDVATQQGSFEEPFIDHETHYDQETVQKWREALREAGELPGLHLQDDANGDEDALLIQIVERIRKILHTPDNLCSVVGIESRIQEVISLLNPVCDGNDDDDDVQVVAVCGPPGIGKTTTARATYNRLAIHFKAQYCCFLQDVKSIFGEPNGKVTLQKKLISNLVQTHESQVNIYSYHQGITKIEKLTRNQKVLFVVDDVDNDEQLKMLGIKRGILGCGSRIIVTTRDVSTVEYIKPDAKYEPRLMDENESLEVFCLNAFELKHPKEGYEEVSMEAVRWGAGHPGVLKDTASYLRRYKSIEQWSCVMRYLIQNPSLECLDE